MEVKELWKPLLEYKGIEVSSIGRIRKAANKSRKERILTEFPINIEYQSLKNIIHKKKQCERLDDQQPSIYTSIYEGSETIPDGSK